MSLPGIVLQRWCYEKDNWINGWDFGNFIPTWDPPTFPHIPFFHLFPKQEEDNDLCDLQKEWTALHFSCNAFSVWTHGKRAKRTTQSTNWKEGKSKVIFRILIASRSCVLFGTLIENYCMPSIGIKACFVFYLRSMILHSLDEFSKNLVTDNELA